MKKSNYSPPFNNSLLKCGILLSLAVNLFSCKDDEGTLTSNELPIDDCSIELTEMTGIVTGTANCENNKCFIPAGKFVMGDANVISPDQCPPHIVFVDEFYIDAKEVTVQKYRDCVSSGNCSLGETCLSMANYQNEDQLPITCVSWFQAVEYCLFAGGRLPTEAEWEKAARGISGPLWPWGNNRPDCSISNFRFASSYCEGGVIEVGSYQFGDEDNMEFDRDRSAFGLFDVSGNAWEWVADWYDAKYYQNSESNNPMGPQKCSVDVYTEPDACNFKVIRGGAFNSLQDATRVTARAFLDPNHNDDNIGFRCAYD